MRRISGAVGVLFLTIFLDLLGFGLIIPILPNYSVELGASKFEVGMLASIYSIMNFVCGPFWGTLSDRIGRRPVMLISIGITVIAYATFIFANSLAILFFSRFLAGIGSANISATQAYLADITTPDKRTKAFGLLGAAFGLGFVFGPPLGGYLKQNYGAEYIGYVATGFCLINFFLAYILLPESLKEFNRGKRFSFNPMAGLSDALQHSTLQKLFGTNFIYIAAFSMMQVTVAILWKEEDGLNEAQIGYTYGFIGIVSALVQGVLIGWITRKLGANNLISFGAAFMMIGLICIPLVPTEWFIPFELIAVALIALANGCITPSVGASISKVVSAREQGKYLGTNQSFGSLARAAGPLLGGALYELGHVYPYILGASLMSLCLIWGLQLKKNFSPVVSVDKRSP